MYKILFICTGNICRSPTAEGVLGHMIISKGLCDHFEVDSAGMHDFHVGEKPYHKSIKAAKEHGINIENIRARQINNNDFFEFDLILAMDSTHYDDLLRIRPKDSPAQIELFLNYANDSDDNIDIDDPYYSGYDAFIYGFNIIEEACKKILNKLIKLYG